MSLNKLIRSIFGMQKEQPAKSNTQEDVLEIPKDKSLIIEKHELKGTPFWVIRIEIGWFLAMGNNRLCEPYRTRKEAEQHLEKYHWQVLFQMALIAARTTQNVETSN